ncbi:FAD-dependent oxidoreductase domain-containing protein 2 isoform X2 [Amia ocellicauda]
MGHFLQETGRDYVILERNHEPGSFFAIYPRHGRLISINKLFTGRHNPEFNLRHDWNSLLGAVRGRGQPRAPLFSRVSSALYPPAHSLRRYLSLFAQELRLRVRYGVDVAGVSQGTSQGNGEKECDRFDQSQSYTLTDQEGLNYTCRVLLVASGLWEPQQVRFPGWEAVEGYESLPRDGSGFQGQAVLILGKGNSAFETAAALLPHTARIALYSPRPVRLAWQTHYVGDLRAVNTELLDTYQLKSLDGLVDGSVEQLALVRDARGRLHVTLAELLRLHGNDSAATRAAHHHDNFSLRRPFDRVVRCLGFRFNSSIFHSSACPRRAGVARGRFPALSAWFEGRGLPGLFVIGAAAHSRDYRHSAGGFIHGFRYTVRAVHRILEQRYHGHPWPAATLQTSQLLSAILRRVNEASGPYQMFGMLGDIILLQGDSFQYLEEFPLQALAQLTALTGRAVGPGGLLVLVMEYGHSLTDSLGQNRSITDWALAWKSNFLHPVLYYYNTLPSERDMRLRPPGWPLPRPQALHHIVEDFLTEWEGPVSHSQPLRRFLEHCLTSDLRTFYAESCFRFALTSRWPPLSCRQGYLQAQGLVGNARLWRHAVEAGLMEDFHPELANESGRTPPLPGHMTRTGAQLTRVGVSRDDL